MSVTSVPVALFLAFHFLAPFLAPGSGWGVHHLAYYPLAYWWLTAAVAAGLFIPAFRRFVIDAISDILRLTQRRAHRSAVSVGTLAIAIASAGALGSAIHLLGDGYLYISELPGNSIRVDHSPLSFWLVRLLFEVGRPILTAEAAYQLYSYAGGALYLVLVLPVARAIASDRAGRVVVIGFLMTAGYVQGFCAYVETYSLVYAGLLLYVWIGLEALAGKRSPIVAGVVLGIIIPLHFLLVTLAPSLLLILLFRAGVVGDRGERPLPQRPSTVLSTLAAVPAVTLVILLALGINPLGYFEWLDRSNSLPLLSSPGFTEAYRLLSLSHLLDLLNQQLLSASAVIIVVMMLRRRAFGAGDGRSLFLLTAGLLPLGVTVVLNPEIGAFRDWDVLAIPSVPLTVWAASALVREIVDSRQLLETGVTLCGAVAIHSVLWIGLNASRDKAELRFTDLMETAALSGHARSYGWDTLGRYYLDGGEPLLELEANEQALAASPENSRHWFNTGLVYLRLEHYSSALYCFERAVTIDGDFLDALDYMAQLQFQLGDVDEANQSLRRMLKLNPDAEHEKRIRDWLQGQKQ